ncbi:hypothetical protein J4Q44_G00194690 [Coregonus suidteri]|uniref:Uncharacterized protein n=1 Tax=Coregonus suidteri TaxID=861788 RepID=A0AAN8QSN8_9TELE
MAKKKMDCFGCCWMVICLLLGTHTEARLNFPYPLFFSLYCISLSAALSVTHTHTHTHARTHAHTHTHTHTHTPISAGPYCAGKCSFHVYCVTGGVHTLYNICAILILCSVIEHHSLLGALIGVYILFHSSDFFMQKI